MVPGRSGWFFVLILFCLPMAAAQSPATVSFRMSGQEGSRQVMPRTIIYKLKPVAEKSSSGPPAQLRETLEHYQGGNSRKLFPGHHPSALKSSSGTHPLVDLSLIFEVQIGDHADLEEAIHELYATGMVEYAQPRYVPTLFYTPDDPMTGSQYYLEKIKAYDAWEVTRGDTNMVIGITDTGIDLNHPDLVGAIRYNVDDPVDGTDNDNDGFVDNYHGWNLGENTNSPQYNAHAHGVHVSGIAAATADNGTGIAGTGFHSRLLPVKVDDELGQLMMAYEGIVYAADRGAKVINCSWGSEFGAGQFGQDIVNYATYNRDAVVIAAAGNSNNDVPFFPASYDNVLSVAATKSDDHKWEGSSYGIYVDVSAPGAGIYSTWANGNYISSSGTSMAAPVVAGAAAILRSHFPEYSAPQIMAQLKVTTDNIDTLAGNAAYQGLLGTGRINLYRAVTETHHPYLQLTGHTRPAEDFGKYQPGDTVSLSSYFHNLLAAAGNITATLTTASPLIEILQPVVNLGAVASDEVVNNIDHPFRFVIGEQLPASAPVIFTITFTNESGGYAGHQRFYLLFNIDYVDVTTPELATTITSRGTVGFNYPNFSQGQGFVYRQGLTLIKNAGLVVGTSSSKMVDNIYGPAEASFNNLLVSSDNASLVQDPATGDITVSGSFTDGNAGNLALGIQVDYNAFFWQQEGHQKYMILEYHIINKSSQAFSSLYAGFFADWVLRDNKNHRAAYDDQHRMGYAWSVTGGHLSGLQLLTPGNMRHYAFDQDGSAGSINIHDGFTGMEKYTALRTNRLNAGAFDQDNDVATLMSSGPHYLEANDTLTVAFAMLAGDHLSDLQESARAAHAMYTGTGNDPTGVPPGEAPQLRLVKVFPNPVAGMMTIEVVPPSDGSLEVMISDPTGKVLMSEHFEAVLAGQSMTWMVNTAHLPPGQYLVTIRGEGFTGSRAFIRMQP